MLQLIWAVFVTASAIALSLGLGEHWSVFDHWILGFFAFVAWISTLCTWRATLGGLRFTAGGVIATCFLLAVVGIVGFGCRIPTFDPLGETQVQTPAAVAFLQRHEALENAIRSGQIENVRGALVGYTNLNEVPDCDPGDVCVPMDAPLTTAVRSGNVPIARLLLEQGASMGEGNLLETAVDHDNAPMLRLLIQHGALRAQGGDRGGAALWSAVDEGRNEAAATLIHAGADVDAQKSSPDSAGQESTVLQVAHYRGNERLVAMLTHMGARETPEEKLKPARF